MLGQNFFVPENNLEKFNYNIKFGFLFTFSNPCKLLESKIVCDLRITWSRAVYKADWKIPGTYRLFTGQYVPNLNMH